MAQSERDRLLMFMRQIDQSGVLPAAKEDALRRLEQHFADQETDAVAVRSHLDRTVRGQAPHLWPQTTPPAAEPRSQSGAGPDKPRRPQPVELTLSQQAEAMKLPPAQRLTYYRELQQDAQTRR